MIVIAKYAKLYSFGRKGFGVLENREIISKICKE